MAENPASPSASLDGIEILAPLTLQHRATLGRRCAWRRYAAGEVIIDRDETGNDVLFVAEGRVRVVNYAPSGREVAYGLVEAGGVVGELAAIDGKPRSASVVAVSPCRIAVLSASAFMALLAEEGRVAVCVLGHLAGIIRENDERITELATVGAMQRVYRALLRLAVPDPERSEGLRVDGLPTQEQLAAEIGTTRETVARVLAQLMRAKITQRRGRTLYIHDADQLEALADPSGEDERF